MQCVNFSVKNPILGKVTKKPCAKVIIEYHTLLHYINNSPPATQELIQEYYGYSNRTVSSNESWKVETSTILIGDSFEN